MIFIEILNFFVRSLICLLACLLYCLPTVYQLVFLFSFSPCIFFFIQVFSNFSLFFTFFSISFYGIVYLYIFCFVEANPCFCTVYQLVVFSLCFCLFHLIFLDFFYKEVGQCFEQWKRAQISRMPSI